ncbi:MAG: GDP-L-fucose synthase [Deltaproteobacteria bacterium]|nr:GDP-L-fucose synthase [Deltaproteobacteria bacterium]MBW1961047.1 GDP-L-fucose synthase [Deltaproteobacteria bacterium]MBW2150063.1 GDP-L-fucose synthase [Deltaproteobacteria bacterium]
MKKSSKIYVAGHTGLVGSAILRKLTAEGYSRIITRTHSELDLIRQAEVEYFFKINQPEYVFLAAAKVGGIWANKTYPAEFIYDNLVIQTNVIHCAWENGVKRLLFLGSSCIYPRRCPQPIKETYLLTGPLEPTNEPYALAKIAGIKMCQSYNRQYGTRFLSAMPTNLYGPGDNFNLETSHVLPALIRKFHEAKRDGRKAVTIWGTGKPRREFMHVDDLADAAVFLMNLDSRHYERFITHEQVPLVNIGFGKDISILELAHLVKEIIGFEGDIVFDTSKPDGTPRKLLDVSRLTDMGWAPRIPLWEGIQKTYEWCLSEGIFGA